MDGAGRDRRGVAKSPAFARGLGVAVLLELPVSLCVYMYICMFLYRCTLYIKKIHISMFVCVCTRVKISVYLFLLGGGGVSRLSFGSASGTPSETARLYAFRRAAGSKNLCMGARSPLASC